VAQHCVENINRLGGKAVTLSDSNGFIYDEDGIDQEKLEWVKTLKNVRRGRIREYADMFGSEYFEAGRPWAVEGAQCAFPCATQNEVSGDDAKVLLANGVYVISEGANMPSVPAAVKQFLKKGVLYGPGKAANAGGVATSGLEMAQNAVFETWTRDEVDQRLLRVMSSIHRTCQKTAEEFGTPGNYVNGANIAGFLKVAYAMLDQGVV
jgi:glutamate dehydrogenase (NADP+)